MNQVFFFFNIGDCSLDYNFANINISKTGSFAKINEHGIFKFSFFICDDVILLNLLQQFIKNNLLLKSTKLDLEFSDFYFNSFFLKTFYSEKGFSFEKFNYKDLRGYRVFTKYNNYYNNKLMFVLNDCFFKKSKSQFGTHWGPRYIKYYSFIGNYEIKLLRNLDQKVKQKRTVKFLFNYFNNSNLYGDFIFLNKPTYQELDYFLICKQYKFYFKFYDNKKFTESFFKKSYGNYYKRTLFNHLERCFYINEFDIKMFEVENDWEWGFKRKNNRLDNYLINYLIYTNFKIFENENVLKNNFIWYKKSFPNYLIRDEFYKGFIINHNVNDFHWGFLFKKKRLNYHTIFYNFYKQFSLEHDLNYINTYNFFKNNLSMKYYFNYHYYLNLTDYNEDCSLSRNNFLNYFFFNNTGFVNFTELDNVYNFFKHLIHNSSPISNNYYCY